MAKALAKHFASDVFESYSAGTETKPLINQDAVRDRNGYSEKTMKISFGDLDLAVPRDSKGDFDPQLILSNKPPCR